MVIGIFSKAMELDPNPPDPPMVRSKCLEWAEQQDFFLSLWRTTIAVIYCNCRARRRHRCSRGCRHSGNPDRHTSHHRTGTRRNGKLRQSLLRLVSPVRVSSKWLSSSSSLYMPKAQTQNKNRDMVHGQT